MKSFELSVALDHADWKRPVSAAQQAERVRLDGHLVGVQPQRVGQVKQRLGGLVPLDQIDRFFEI